MTLSISKIVASRLAVITNVRPMACKYCQEPIVFVKTVNGGSIPLDLELRNHLELCPGSKGRERKA